MQSNGFAKHYAEQQFLFEERNNVLRWKVKADLSRFGGKGIQVKERHIPLISNTYNGVDWQNAFQVKDNGMVYLLSHEELEQGESKETSARYTQEKKQISLCIRISFAAQNLLCWR